MSSGNRFDDFPTPDVLWLMYLQAAASDHWSLEEREQITAALEAGHPLLCRIWTDSDGKTWISTELDGNEIVRIDARNLGLGIDWDEAAKALSPGDGSVS